MKKVFITLLSMTMVGTAIAGTNDASNDFKAGGKPIATIFTDFKYSMYDSKQNAAFEISRA